jgi:hypothetical protein
MRAVVVVLFALCATIPVDCYAQSRRAGGEQARAEANALDVAEGQKRLEFLGRALCPGLESRTVIAGLDTPAARQAIIQARFAEAETKLRGFADAESQFANLLAQNPNLANSRAGLREREALNADAQAIFASAGAALVDWWLAWAVSMREINPSFSPDSAAAHPLASFVQAGAAAQAALASYASHPAFITYVAPALNKYTECLQVLQDQVVNENAALIRQRVPKLTTSAQLLALEGRYAVAPGGFDARGAQNVPVAIAELRTEFARIKAKEDAEAERLRIMADAKAREEFERRQRAAAAEEAAFQRQLQRDIVVAQRFIAAARTADVNGMGAVLHPDVVATLPRRAPMRGKAAVVDGMRSTMSQGRAAPQFADPEISGRQIVAALSAQGQRAYMIFKFSGGLVIALDVN